MATKCESSLNIRDKSNIFSFLLSLFGGISGLCFGVLGKKVREKNQKYWKNLGNYWEEKKMGTLINVCYDFTRFDRRAF